MLYPRRTDGYCFVIARKKPYIYNYLELICKSDILEVRQMDELIAILKDIHPDVDYETATNLVDGKILDSFDIISLVSEIADKFDVVVSAEYMIPENFNSAKALWELIEKLQDEE